jgi:hypothetical protein
MLLIAIISSCSKVSYKYLKRISPNKVVFIPQHHCNFERLVRNRNQVTTVGVIGTPGFLARLPANFEKKLTPNGVNLLRYFSFRNRQDVINFYQKIDVQIVWRPWPSNLSNPLKIVNAASFGIPTLAYPENTFDSVLKKRKNIISKKFPKCIKISQEKGAFNL